MKIKEIIISKIGKKYYLELRGGGDESIYIKDQKAQLELTDKEISIMDTFNEKMGTLAFDPKSKKLKFKITRYAGESCDYDLEQVYKNCWKIKNISQHYLNYVLETIYYEFKEAVWDKIVEETKNKNVNERVLNSIENGTYSITFGKTKAGQRSKEKEIYEFKNNLRLSMERLASLKERLAGFYDWELKREINCRKSEGFFMTNPHHVEQIKKQIKELRA